MRWFFVFFVCFLLCSFFIASIANGARMRTPNPNYPAGSASHYDRLYREFRWHVPDDFNLAQACCRRWANDASRTAVCYEDAYGLQSVLSYAELARQANRLSNVLAKLGIRRGDRIAII